MSETGGAADAQPRAAAAYGLLVVFLVGAVLRIVYTAGTDVRNVYDDHFHVTRIIVNEGRWPRPDEGWQTYQPPLYHWLSGVVYRTFSASSRVPAQVPPTVEEATSPQGPRPPTRAHWAGRKAIQFVSTAAGIVTVALIWRALRSVFPTDPFAQCVGLALAAFQPRLIYMSGMATNDALVTCFGTLALYALIRAVAASTRPTIGRETGPRQGRATPGSGDQRAPRSTRAARGGAVPLWLAWWVISGLAIALGLWTKAYAIVFLPLVGAIPALALLPAFRFAWRRLLLGAVAALAVSLLLGAWHYVRMYHLTGNPLASNVELRPHNLDRMYPGSRRELSFVSFKLPALLRHPWVHLDTVGSFWTSVYGELWFDFGTTSTVYNYKPWLMHIWPVWRDESLAPRERERRGLIWDTDVMPIRMVWQGRALYVLGLLPTLAALGGLVSVLLRRVADPGALVSVAALIIGVAVPLQQTLRVPIRSSMKATYGLFAVAAMVLLAAWGVHGLGGSRIARVVRAALAVNLLLLGIAVAWHFLDLALVFPYSPDYFARRDAW